MAATLTMKGFKTLMLAISSETAVMVRGRPGIGKSQGVAQVGEESRRDFYRSFDNCVAATTRLSGEASVVRALSRFYKTDHGKSLDAQYQPSSSHPFGLWHYDMGVPVVERRLSQMTEGDMIGLPFDSQFGTIFKPCAWLLAACEFPVILFLDELNRAIKGVEQATFQLADSKAFYGHHLHDETRVFIACNVGDQYDVSPMDPAAVSRYCMVDLDPTKEDWLEWSKKRVNPLLTEFVVANPHLLEYVGTFEPNTKYPDRRAWTKLDLELTHTGLYDTPEELMFYQLSASMVGMAAAQAFTNYVKVRGADITGKDVLTNWTKAKARMPKDVEQAKAKYVELSSRVITESEALSKKGKFTASHVNNYCEFAGDTPMEVQKLLLMASLVVSEALAIKMVALHSEGLAQALTATDGELAPKPPAATTSPTPGPAPAPRQRKSK